MTDLTHIDENGRAKMVDVGQKTETLRSATATGRIIMKNTTMQMIAKGRAKKGDVLGVAQVAGIMAAKKTPDIIPMCHSILLTGVSMDFALYDREGSDSSFIQITAITRCKGQTGVEMEALHAVSAAALTIYDMCKAVDRGMRIEGIRLLEKTGGKSGVYRAKTMRKQSEEGVKVSAAKKKFRLGHINTNVQNPSIADRVDTP